MPYVGSVMTPWDALPVPCNCRLRLKDRGSRSVLQARQAVPTLPRRTLPPEGPTDRPRRVCPLRGNSPTGACREMFPWSLLCQGLTRFPRPLKGAAPSLVFCGDGVPEGLRVVGLQGRVPPLRPSCPRHATSTFALFWRGLDVELATPFVPRGCTDCRDARRRNFGAHEFCTLEFLKPCGVTRGLKNRTLGIARLFPAESASRKGNSRIRTIS